MVNYRNDEAFEIKGYWSDSERLFDNPTGEDAIAGTLSYLPAREATLQLFGSFVDGSGEKATPFKLYGMAGQRKIVLKDIQLKRFSNKSFPPFALTEADYVAFDFDIFMPGDLVDESRTYDKVVLDFSNLSVWRRPVDERKDTYILDDMTVEFITGSGRNHETLGVHTVTEVTRSRIRLESAVGKNRQEWITLAKDFQDFLSLVFMKPVSIEYIGFGDTNSPLLVQPFFWKHVKPDEVKLEKSGGITFDFARLKPGLFIKTNKNPLKRQVNTVSAGFALSPVG
ncbi:hypothetical protein E0F22_07580 [Weissella confusa]|uniref:ApeA N-terminal domain 1-containing protein n=1 Tax=Weissella confusa TaxID=1583 RepID=UPI00168137E8|nr:hypothetical protein [Weissella confusa]MBD1491803.1 hypothetical protein [Weissella confusa]MBJ7664437.1 hypothetical protein [Weissella confusa]